MLFIFYLFSIIVANQCIWSSEVPSTVYVGFINDDEKTESRKESALIILNWYKDWLNQWSGRQSFRAVHGEISGFMWVGSMVQNSGFSSNVVTDFIDEIETSSMPTEIYYEFLHTNALQTFGIILTTRGLNKAQTAVKRWSQGVSYGEGTCSKSSNRLSICYLDYGNRKDETNDKEAGECFYKRIGLNELPSGNAGEYLKAFNPSLDFTKLQVNQPYCYSEGVLPNFKPAISSDGKCNTYKVGRGDTCNSIASSFYPLTVEDIEKYNKDVYGWGGCQKLFYGTNICLSEGAAFNCETISSDLLFGFIVDTNKDSSDIPKVVGALNYFKNEINSSPDKRVLYYKDNNVVGYVWIGQKVNNLDHPIDVLVNEVKTQGVPHLFHYSYIVSDPRKSFGVVIDSRGDEDIMKEIVKTWSSGETYNKHGSKRLSTDFCLLSNSQKGFGDYSDLGNCISFVYDNVLPLEYSVIEDYNPSTSIEKGNKLCKSVGNKESEQEECSIYIAKEGDTCESIAESFPSLTTENIEEYNARNPYFYGCDNIIEGDRLCVSKSHT